MATYIVLANFTDQGVRNVKDTTRRAEAFQELAKASGAALKNGSAKIAAPNDAPSSAATISTARLYTFA